MIDKFIFEPYVGTNLLRFDMTPDEVEKLLGPAESVIVNALGERDEQRGLVSVRYSLSNGVVEIAFLPAASLVFHDRSLFDEPDVIGYLSVFDPNPFEWVGFVIFLGIGITATGFHDGNDSQRAFTIFREGRWDQFRGEFKRLTLL